MAARDWLDTNTGVERVSKAIVLSGGGSVGIAWQTGLVAGLAAEGVDLRDGDFVIGTSAGSAVGAQIALGRDMAQAMERFETTRDSERPRRAASDRPDGGGSRERMRGLMEVLAKSGASPTDPKQARAAIGRFALDAKTVDEASFLRGFSYLEGATWPAAFRCTSVDAESGRFKVWDAEAGVDLMAAVASSCAVPGLFPPITLEGRRYIDGGMRSGTNADIAKGHDRVLIITLMGRRAAGGDGGARVPGMGIANERELSILRDAGACVETLAPDPESGEVIGVDLMNPRLAGDAARAGLRQGKAAAGQLRAFWS